MEIRPSLSITALLALQGVAVCQQPQGKPDIAFIPARDHAAGAISWYEGSLNRTPNIDFTITL